MRPFPGFLDAGDVQAVEVDPSGVPDVERGCILVCPDGELYEFVLRLVPGRIDVGGGDQMEELKAADLSPGDYVAYAHPAVCELSRIIEEGR